MAESSRGLGRSRSSKILVGLGFVLAITVMPVWSGAQENPEPPSAEPKASPAKNADEAPPDLRSQKLAAMVQDAVRQLRELNSRTDGDEAMSVLIAAMVHVLDPKVDKATRERLSAQLLSVMREGPRPSAEPILPPTTATPPSTSAQPAPFAPARFSFKIDPKTPIDKLLPTPPKTRPAPGIVDDLAQVTEVSFEERFDLRKNAERTNPVAHVAHNIAKINHANKAKTDGFMIALLSKRQDLTGLPFTMGDDCRLKEERSRQFNQALGTIRALMQQNLGISVADADQAPQRAAEVFWENFHQMDRSVRVDAKVQEHFTVARIAALVQVLGPQSVHMRRGLVKYLAGVSHRDATRALAKLAVYTAEDDVRLAAVEALKTRRERDYTDILVQALRYPLPAVAKRAGEALAKLERNDLVTELVALLDEPDPRAPRVKDVDNKKVPVMREVVKINHHRNCLMCHAPGEMVQGPVMRTSPVVPLNPPPQAPRSTPSEVSEESRFQPISFTAAYQPETVPPASTVEKVQVSPAPGISPEVPQGAIPIPGEPLPSPSTGYQSSHPDILVRVDVTYLRQDFSLMLPVTDAAPWPEMQRFDFLVRNRVLTKEEAQAVNDSLQKSGASPYQQVAHTTLRALTGRDAEPNAEAWRRVLRLSNVECGD